MPWNGNVTGSSVASNAQAHGPKEMDRVNRYFNDVDLEALAGDLSIATIRTKTRFRSNKLQFIADDGHIINIIIPTLTNDKDVTLPNDSGTLALGGGGTPISVIENLGVGGVGVFKNAAAGTANFYSFASISPAIDLALDAANNLIEIDLDETVINLSNLTGTLPISKGGTGQTTKTNAFDALAPTTLSGDMIYRNASGDNVRLAIGPNGYVLGVVSGVPTWIPAPAGGGGGGGGGTDITLFRNTTVVDVVSTAAETNLFSFTVPANTMGTTGLVRIIVTGSYINNSGSDDKYALRLKLGGVTIWSDESGTQSTSSNRRPVFIQLFIKNNNSASSQKVGGTFINGNDVLGDVGISDISSDEIRGQSPIVASASINTAADQVLALTVDHDDSSSNISFQADIISVELIGGTGGGGTGDITGATNQGTGVGIFKDESGGLLNFKSLIAGTNVTLTPGTNDITISATGGGGGGSPGGVSGDVQYNSGSSTFAAEAAFNYDATNNELNVPGLTVNEDFRLNAELNPAQITADQNDYNPTGLATAARLRLNSDASRNITGLATGLDGRILFVTNIGSFNIVLVDESASSTNANRFALGANLTIAPGKTVQLIYDNITNRWRLVEAFPAAGGTTPAGASGNLQYNSGSSTFAAASTLTYDSATDDLTVPSLVVNGFLRLNEEISPAQLTANTNDWSPTGIGDAARIRASTDASRNLTGITNGSDGKILIISNIGTNPLVLKNEDAGSTAANRFTLGADLTLTADKVAVLMYSAHASRWTLVCTSVDQTGAGGGGTASELNVIEQARQRVSWIEDFFSLVDKPNWIPLVTGTGAAVNGVTVGTEAAYGIAEVNSGTTATGESAIVFGHSATVKPIRLGAGILTVAFRIRFPNLSTSTQEYRAEVGLVDDPQTSGANNRVWMEYDRTNALFWTMICSAGGVNSELDTSSTVGTGWTTIKIVINAAANSVEFFVDGTSVGTRTASIPTGVDLFPAVTMFKTVGTTARTILVDYVAFDYELTTTR